MPQPTVPSLPAKYKASDHEAGVRARWEASGAFHADPARVISGERLPYSIFIPPPNVTARLHLGHALNNTLQDILARIHRMKGFEVLWMPGTDHAGIGTQAVVERRLRNEGAIKGPLRDAITREDFVAQVQAWKDEYERAITDQLKALGCSCDWARQRFTMDEVCARAVREAFFILFRDGLIHRGKRLVNWDPANQTALADDEVEMEEVDGYFYYMRYLVVSGGPALRAGNVRPVTWSELARLGYPGASKHPADEQAWLTVATTRPETYLGDTAVAVNPKDARASSLEGLSCELPLVGRVIPIIKDDYVVMPASGGAGFRPASGSEDPKAKYATGFLKVTPAHDPNDYDIGRRHNLPIINVMAPDASISDKHGWSDVGDARLFLGLSREKAREKVVAEFKARGLLEKQTPYRHSVGHSYRSHVPIEPYLSDQWYCKVTDDRLRGSALSAMAAEQRSTTYQAGGAGLQSAGGANLQSSGAGFQPARTTLGGRPAGTGRELTIHRRRLPHWEFGGRTYFITFRVGHGVMSPVERRIAAKACGYWQGDRASIHLITVMPDHVHMLVTPLRRGDGSWHTLSDLLQSIKGDSAKLINESRRCTGPFWQDESYDRIVRDEHEFAERWSYMINNPVKAGLVDAPDQYEFIHSPEWASQGLEPWKTRWGPGRLKACPTDLNSGRHPLQAAAVGFLAAPSGDGALTFFPERYARTYESWHENLRDWCISRQLWWGHRIPVWSGPVSTLDAHCRINHTHVRFGEPFDLDIEGTRVSVILVPRGTAADCFVCVPPGAEHVDRRLSEMGLSQDDDVLDTWFSSALWPISTLGWPDPPSDMKGLLDAFNPSAVLCTARDIITLWVSRMVMFNRYFLGSPARRAGPPPNHAPGRVPFRHVYINPVVQDGHGQRMSKSLGNGVDPLDIIHSHGTDALRLILCQMATSTQDVRMPVDLACPHCGHAFEPAWITSPAGYKVAAPSQTCPACKGKMVSAYGVSTGTIKPAADAPLARNSSSKFDAGRNFCTKLWNATRFAMMNLEGAGGAGRAPAPSALPLPDRWMLSRLARTIRQADDALADYQFARYAEAMYDLFWRDFCDWYLESIKPTVRSSPDQQVVLRHVLDSILRLLHPITPYVTEVLFEALRETGAPPPESEADVLCLAAWPSFDASRVDEDAERDFARLQALVEQIRQVRSAKGVEPRRRVTLHTDAQTASAVVDWKGMVESLAGLDRVATTPAGPGDAPFVFEGRPCALSNLIDASDPADERRRLAEAVARLEKDIGVIESRLDNPGYAAKAPPHLVAETRASLETKKAEREAFKTRLADLN
jgi:valyl-tRNA synthetase